eukprot:1150195-Pelagomonas_calceolata.AAC.2
MKCFLPVSVQHATVLKLLDAQLKPGHRVLDVGSGERWPSKWQCALSRAERGNCLLISCTEIPGRISALEIPNLALFHGPEHSPEHTNSSARLSHRLRCCNALLLMINSPSSGSGYLVAVFAKLVLPGGCVLGLEKVPELASRPGARAGNALLWASTSGAFVDPHVTLCRAGAAQFGNCVLFARHLCAMLQKQSTKAKDL